MSITNLTELAAFFPSSRPASVVTQRIRSAPMRPGESHDQALKRQDERAARIRKQIADRADRRLQTPARGETP